MGRGLIAVLTITALLVLLAPAEAQTTFGTVTGIITDQTGAVIPGALVAVRNEGTGQERQTKTSETGVFVAPNLGVGAYAVRAQAAGFQPEERAGLVLNANQTITVNFQLGVAATALQTEVHGSMPVIDTETSTLTNVKTSRDLQQLPMASRNTGDLGFYGYTFSNPGISKVAGQASPAVNGMPVLDTWPTIDGIAVMAYGNGMGGGPVQPSIEGIEQVNFELANPQAEFARPGNFTVVTKSGTNKYHGGLFYDYNGNRLNSRNFFSAKVPFRIYNNFAASIGGPIRKNKTFYYVDYEGSREAATTAIVANTPLVPWRTGDFSGQSRVVTDPATGQPFPGKQIPASRIHPVSQKLQDFFYPPPNYGSPTLEAGNWRGQRPGQNGFTRFDNVDARVDHTFRPGDTVFTRVSYRRLPVQAYEQTLPPVGQRDQLRNTRSGVLSYTHSFSPVLLNEFRTGFTRGINRSQAVLIGRDILKNVGLQGIGITDPARGVPAFNITGITTTDQPNAANTNIDTSFEWTDNLSWARGSHFFKFGGDAIRDQMGGESHPNSMYGVYNFTGTFTGLPYADFLLGIPQSTSRIIRTRSRYLRGTIASLYVQDQFKVNRRLTVNYGLRWEMQLPYHDKFGAIYSFDPATGSVVVPDEGLALVNPAYPKNIPIRTASKAGVPAGSMIEAYKRGVYPRVGFAYTPFRDGKTVIRGGYGIFANTVFGSAAYSSLGGPFAGSESFTNAITNGVPLFSFPNPFLALGATATQNVLGINPHLRTPYSQQYNFTVERQLGSVGVRVAYVGTHSTNLVYTRNLNQPPASTTKFTNSRRIYPLYNIVTWYDNGGTQQYHALQVSGYKSYGRDLTFNTGWTWAKDLTDTQNTGSFAGQRIENSYDRAVERANNTLTRPHRLYANVIWTLPVGQGQRLLGSAPAWAQQVVGGWNVSAAIVVQSGQYYSPSFAGFDVSNTNLIGGRPDRIGSGIPSSGQSIFNWFNSAAFKIPGCPDADPVCKSPANVGRFGNSGLNVLRGPAANNVNLSVMKYFTLTEGVRLQFRCFATNAFNHANFANPAANISSPGTVGRITSTFAEQVSENLRYVHFSLRLEF